MLGAMFRLFWNWSKRVNPCKASRIIRMLHHSPTRSRLRAMGQASCRSFCVAYTVTIMMQVMCPQESALTFLCNLLSRNRRSCCDSFQNYTLVTIMTQVTWAELEPTFRQVPITRAANVVTSTGSRAAIFGMILTLSRFYISNQIENWHIRCSDLVAYYETCSKPVHEKETVNNERKPT